MAFAPNDAARLLAPARSLEFVFSKGRHDAGEKTALGEVFPAGHGEDEGTRLLKLLAAHPAGAKHLARKLYSLFVADEPPPSCTTPLEGVKQPERRRELSLALLLGSRKFQRQ